MIERWRGRERHGEIEKARAIASVSHRERYRSRY